METTYNYIIQQVLAERCAINPNYSMRAYARDLEISPSTLSEILNGKKGISSKKAIELANHMRLPDWQKQYFIDLVAIKHAKSPLMQKEAKLRLKNHKQENNLHILNHNTMKSLTSWIDLAILELTYLDTFKPTTKWISTTLDVEEKLVLASVKRLKASELLRIDDETGMWIDVSPLFTSTDDVPSESIRGFHQTVLLQAIKKLEKTDIQSRTVKTVVFSLSHENKSKAKNILNDAIAKIVSLSDESSQNREDVMCFSTQLFSLLNIPKDTL